MRLILLFLALFCAAPLRAHEFWIAPEAYQIAPSEDLVAHLRVGQDFAGSAQSYFPQQFVLFEVKMSETSAPVEGRLGDIPALRMAPPSEGLAVILHQTTALRLTYSDPAKFTDFVTHKDLDGVLARHTARGLPESGFSEKYTRYAKALVAVGEGRGADTPVGFHTEIVALANPYTDDLWAGLPVQLLYRGAPRADAQVELFARNAAGVVDVTLHRTNARGRVTLPVTSNTEYLVDAVVMEETGNDDPAAGAVWHSHWAALTFRTP